MTILIKHRINTLKELQQLNMNYGCEVDVRYHENELILSHHPFNHHILKPEKFENFLKIYNHNMLVVNLKTEGIEEKCFNLLKKYNIKDFYFLDMSVPYFVKYSIDMMDIKILKENMSLRYSPYENLPDLNFYKDKAKHIWIDSFFDLNFLSLDDIKRFKDYDFKLTFVSPELHGVEYEKDVKLFSCKYNNLFDYVCTKKDNFWK